MGANGIRVWPPIESAAPSEALLSAERCPFGLLPEVSVEADLDGGL